MNNQDTNQPTETQYDLAVIGAGTAGLVSAFAATSMGARVALIEKERIGGECLWTGCVPSKALIQSARVYETVKTASEFGVHCEELRVIWSALRLRLQDVRDDIKKLEREELDKTDIEVLSGTASFVDGSTLRVTSKAGEQTIRAKKFIVAAGTKPRIPEIEGLEETGFITHEQLFDLPNKPRSLVIIGGGPIGVEMAQAFCRLDCKVTLLQRGSTLLPKEDEEISAAVEAMLQQDGVKVVLNAEVQKVDGDIDKKYVTYEVDGQTHKVSGSEVLIATGKVCDLTELNIEAAGATWDEDSLKTDEYLRAAPTVWACGDVVGKLLFTHVAEYEAKIATQNALLPVGPKTDYSVVPWVTFTDPEVAHLGLTEVEVKKQWGQVKIFRQEFSKLDRAIIEGQTRGFLKVVCTGSGRVVGVHIIGSRAGELIHSFVPIVKNGGLIQELAETIFAYPTLSEIGHKAGNEYFQELLESKLVKGVLKRLV